MRASCATVMIAAMAAAQEPPLSQTEALDRRVERLEREVERLRLQADEPGEASPAQGQTQALALGALNPTLTVVGNGVYRWDDRAVVTDGGERVDRRFLLREVEMDFRAAIDPFADGLLIVSIEQEAPDQFATGVEEGFASIKRLPIPILDRPPLGLQLKVGRFRTETGSLNRIHTHDLPHVYRPLAIEEFLGPEGMIGEGASAQVLLPTPDDESALTLVGQAVRGGASRLTEDGRDAAGFVASLAWFRPLGPAHSLAFAAIGHEGETTPGAELRAWMVSGDALYKWRPPRGGESRSFVLGGQVFYARRRFSDGVTRQEARPLGGFAFAQVQPWRTIYVGGRYDDTETIADDRVRRQAASGYASWYPSEFLRFRAGYERRFSDIADEDRRDSVFAEINFVFGSHPPEPFWVNR